MAVRAGSALKTWQEALKEFLISLKSRGYFDRREEEVPTAQALGRVTSLPVRAFIPSPHYRAAAVDGLAVKAKATFSARESVPVVFSLGQGALLVDTGDPVPEEYDAVIRKEELILKGDKVFIKKPVAPGDNIRPVGEDFPAGERLFPSRHLLSPVDLACLLSGGVTAVRVWPRPRAALLPTGDEVVPPQSHPAPGQVLESNSTMLAGLITLWGGCPQVLPIVPDDPGLLEESLDRALEENDMVLVIAGSSAGNKDYTAQAVARKGQLLTHGVAIRPGRPVILGVARERPVIGVPGYPISAFICAQLFVRPLVYHKQGLIPPPWPRLKARLARKVFSPLGVEEFIRVRLEKEGKILWAVPSLRGASTVLSLARSHGMVAIPPWVEGYGQGEEVQVYLLPWVQEKGVRS